MLDIDKLEAIQQNLKIWRIVILILTVIMLFISLISNDEMSIITLIICFFSIVLFQLKTLPATSYQFFILILLCFAIFILGKSFELYYEKRMLNITQIIKILYNELTLMIFIVVLWRHYQKDNILMRMQMQNDII